MLEMSLNGLWKMKINGQNVFDISEDYMEAKVPGTVYSTLLELGKMPDPFYRDNELKALKLMENDFTYTLNFDLSEEMLTKDALLLHFDGIDTLADIFLNDKFLGDAFNMHRIWEYDIKEFARSGENELKVVLHSPTKYIKDEQEKCYTGGSSDAMEGFPISEKLTVCLVGIGVQDYRMQVSGGMSGF
ncbi:glycosyl hydrolase 2 galactose-binding domain-containing protein [Anaerocolumna sedimenticola]|uniref:glycosyl hydrolase 2 galactose-binding domain-containing protein n=1 Tax=Anaerocolumna sedimenticola TaxID=2696063 RepID=UPI002ED34A37